MIKETTEVVQRHFPYAHLRKADDSGNLRFEAENASNSVGEFRRAHTALRKDLDKLPFSATATRLKVKTHQNWLREITTDTNWTADIRVHVHKRLFSTKGSQATTRTTGRAERRATLADWRRTWAAQTNIYVLSGNC